MTKRKMTMTAAACAAMLIAGCATAPRAPIEPHPDTAAYAWKPLFAKDLSDAGCIRSCLFMQVPNIPMRHRSPKS